MFAAFADSVGAAVIPQEAGRGQGPERRVFRDRVRAGSSSSVPDRPGPKRRTIPGPAYLLNLRSGPHLAEAATLRGRYGLGLR
jgi:hypothetical protein